MTTALRLITRSAQLIGVVRTGEALSADEASDALATLNDMLGGWSNNNLLITSYVRESFPLTANDGVYTIGAGLDFDTTAPLHIVAGFTREATVDYPMEAITDQEFYQLVQKDTTSGRPYYWNYDNAGTIRFYPLPTTSYEFHMLSEKPISDVTLSTELSFKTGWERCLRYNLAIELAAEYGMEVPRSVAVIAATSLAEIKRQVSRKRPMRKDKTRSVANIYTGYNW